MGGDGDLAAHRISPYVSRPDHPMKNMLLAAVAAAALASPATAAPAAKPKLVVVISIDQFGADLFSANRARFRHGLRQLSDGIVYPSAYHAHGQTETCAGHAVILAGRHPSKTGVVANQWYDPATGKSVYCTDDGAGVAAITPRAPGIGPGLLVGSTFADWVKAADPMARVVAIAGKDRSAIMLAGHQPDAAFWLTAKGFDTWGPDPESARRRLDLLTGFNAVLAARKPTVWTYADPACRALERDVPLSDGQRFASRVPPPPPPPFPGSPLRPDATPPPPVIDALTLEAASRLIRTMDLGAGAGSDLIGIGLSGTDMVGHAYGTQGPEMCDQLAHLDRSLGRFLAELRKDRREILVVVTADHGGGDFPERLAERGYGDARRLDPRPFLTALNAQVRAQAGVDWSPIKSSGFDVTQLYVVDRAGRPMADDQTRARILEQAVSALRAHKDVAGAWAAQDLASRKVDAGLEAPLLDLGDRMALSFFPGRSGDISVALDPMVTPVPAIPGLFLLGHGSPYDTNRRVPLIFWWPGVAAQERTAPVNVVDLAPTLADALGVPVPTEIDGRSLHMETTYAATVKAR